MTDRTADVSEALWELERRFGLGLPVPDQVGIARTLGARPKSSLTTTTVVSAFQNLGLKPPSKTYATALVARMAALAPRPDLLSVLLDYRTFAIRNLSGQFGGKTRGREEELRLSLLTFLPERGYTEARTGRGRTDILLPVPTRIIEIKVWESALAYEDGMIELGRYIHTEQPKAAYMVVFGDRVPLPGIVDHHGKAIAEVRKVENTVVSVVVIPFEVDPPSKAARADRRRARAGR